MFNEILFSERRRTIFAVEKKGRWPNMGCTKESTKETKGGSIEFQSFQSDKCESISEEKAKEQKKIADEIRG